MQRLNPRQTPESSAPLRAAVAAEPDERPDRRPAKSPAPTEENKPPAAEFSPVRKLPAGSHTQQPTVSGQELVTSRFTAGGRGLVLAALKQRSHSAPSRREVTVQLLEPGPLQNSPRDGQEPPSLRNSSQHSLGLLGVQMEAGLLSGFHGNNASTANLIKTQALMEAQMSRLNDNVHQLLQAHRDRGCLSQQMLHHLETLHSQQLQLQSQLLESATRVATGPASTSHQLTATAPVFSSQHGISSNTSHVATVTAGCYGVPEQSRGVSMTTQPDAGSLGDVMSGRANELLTEMKHLRAEMKKLLITEASVKATRPGSGHQQSQSTSIHIHPTQSNQSSSTQVQSRPVVPSTLEMAGLVLRQVQRQKKVLEENLGGQLRAQRGAVLHCQLDALAANRNSTHNLRIKKMVGDWIDTLTEEIQVDISQDAVAKRSARRDAVVASQQRGAGSAAPTFQRTPVRMLRGTGHSSSSHGLRPGAGPERATVRRPDSAQAEAESYLSRLYGSTPHDGTRRTLKKSPYLRFKSPPSPPSKKLRPRLVERVRGVKVKSCKTQTCLAPTLIEPPGPPQYHYIVDSTHLAPADPTVSYSVPTAIPLGPPTQPQQEVTSLAVPPTSAMVAKEDRDSKLQLQEEQQHDAGNAPPPHVDIIDRKTEEEEETEDEAFVGPDFLCVADVTQDEGSIEEMVQLEGGPPPPSVLYHGPSFPPQTCTALPSQDQAHVPALDPQMDGLENRLLEWVEQQIMSRMISEMYHPPPSDPTQKASADPSDIVEAAGCGGLQLVVDSGVSVDSGLIKQLVEEVLTEHVALMLEHREAPGTQPEPGLEAAEPDSGPYQEEELVPPVPTPEPTPPPCSTLSIRETPPLTTPPPSEPTSLLNEDSAQPITEPVATPTSSLEPTPTDGSPPAAHQTTPPLTSENPELPLAEQQDTHTQLTMSVPPPGPGPEVRPASPHSSSEESSNTSSNTVTTGTDAALRPVSDGELLSSVQLEATMTDEEALCSFSTSLQELQDMDFDPPSEGQVRGQAHLPANMEDRVPEKERPQPEGSQGSAVQEEEEEMSVGEVKGKHTTKHRSHCEMIAACRHHASESPGHSPDLSPCTDMQALSFETTNQSSLAMSILGEQIGTLTSDLQTGMCLSPPPALEDRFTPEREQD